jgi:small subunit ribosomal protein S18
LDKRSRRGGRGSRDKRTEKQQGQRRPMFRRRKVCKFCATRRRHQLQGREVDRPLVLARQDPAAPHFTCAMHQRKLQTAIKRARQIALIPYVTE